MSSLAGRPRPPAAPRSSFPRSRQYSPSARNAWILLSASELQIRINNREDSLLPDHRKQSRRNHMNSRKTPTAGAGPDRLAQPHGARPLPFVSRTIALSDQTVAVANSFALHGQRRESPIFPVTGGHPRQIDRADDIDIMQKERVVRRSGSRRKNQAAFFSPPPVSSNASSRDISICIPKLRLAASIRRSNPRSGAH